MRSSHSGNLAPHYVTTVSGWAECLPITLVNSGPAGFQKIQYRLVSESSKPAPWEFFTSGKNALPNPISHWESDFSWPESQRAVLGLTFPNRDISATLIEFE